MAIAPKPDMRPANPNFSSGPCAKRPGFTLDALSGAVLGRSHRASGAEGAARRGDRALARDPRHAGRLAARHRARLRHRRGRDGAVVAARRARRSISWRSRASARAGPPTSSSSSSWPMRACCRRPMGDCPISRAVDFARDVVFPWNGTTSGVRVPNGDWIARGSRRGWRSATPPRRRSRWRCRGTSSMSSPGPGRRCWAARRRTACWRCRRARWQRLETYKPAWPLPKIFRLTTRRQADRGHLQGRDDQHAVHAVRRGRAGRAALGGSGRRPAGADRAVARPISPPSPAGWREPTGLDFLAEDPATRSCTSICLKIVAPWFTALPPRRRRRRRSSSPRCWRRKAWPTTSAPIATRRRACASGAAPRSRPPTSRRCCPGSTGRRVPQVAECA